ncbi:hypothetical protein BD626DRAFT_512334 [Schizophyllum amplum]|uniref:NAD-dependent epimerase/dehydratase domain-containing protein n=1 Tax=Schizophyllum amplum TaxID=97359 RepID=A0A550C025_9AGAR|nr:hypothetical protein BD626DRAFT_512334 [Auriculariopsis ampla]
MPALSNSTAPPPKVLVTGANGFVAMWVVRTLLERGFSVKGQVRSAVKGEHLVRYFKDHEGRFELVVVPDIAEEGAFDAAVMDVSGVIHMASPVSFDVEDPQDLIRPALNGTLGVLKSALKHGRSIQRIVVTASVASIVEDRDTPTVFSEADWNTQAVRDIEANGAAASAMSKYRASKTLAERAAWDFVEEHKSEIGWDLTVINPPMIFGPVIHEVTTPSALNFSAIAWYTCVATPDMGGKPKEFILARRLCWVDVRDVAEAHVRALEKEAAGGKRIIASAGSLCWQEFINTANALPTKHTLPRGFPDDEMPTVAHLLYDATRSKEVLGMSYRTMEETTRDILADYDARGW